MGNEEEEDKGIWADVVAALASADGGHDESDIFFILSEWKGGRLLLLLSIGKPFSGAVPDISKMDSLPLSGTLPSPYAQWPEGGKGEGVAAWIHLLLEGVIKGGITHKHLSTTMKATAYTTRSVNP